MTALSAPGARAGHPHTFEELSAMNLYQRLGITRKASPAEIKDAYRAVLPLYHPDHGGDVRAMQKVNEAQTTLLDGERREIYDQTGRTAFDPEGPEIRRARETIRRNAAKKRPPPAATVSERERQVVERLREEGSLEAARQPWFVELLARTKDPARERALFELAHSYKGITMPQRDVMRLLDLFPTPAHHEMLVELLRRVELSSLLRNPIWQKMLARISVPHGLEAARLALLQGAGMSPSLFRAASTLTQASQVEALTSLMTHGVPLEPYLQGVGLQNLGAVTDAAQSAALVRSAVQAHTRGRAASCGLEDRLRQEIRRIQEESRDPRRR